MEEGKNKFHALQLFTDTFIAETVHLNNAEVGIYIRLLCFAWTKNTKPFSTKDAIVICQCKNDKCETAVKEILIKFFDKSGLAESTEYWTHKRLVQEHSYLVDKYKKRSIAGKKGAQSRYGNGTSSNANGKLITPIPSPSPIPNKIYSASFEKLWNMLDRKRGAKFTAHKEFLKIESERWDKELTIELLAKKYNEQIKDISEAKFVPHFATWLHQRRWEIDEKDGNLNDSATIITKMEKLGYVFLHTEDRFNYFKKDNKQYKIDRYDKEHMILDA
jgi:uncharacterized protein YdaU (DUF1376 family)